MRYLHNIIMGLAMLVSTQAWAAKDCTLLVDYPSGKTLVQQGECEQRYSPASTFKVPLALMGFDAGILKDEHTPAWPFKESYLVNKDNDKQTTDPTLWEANSVVWYSQKLTSTLGMEKFQAYIDQFNYGNKDLSGDKGQHNGLTRAWLSSSMQVSPLEQADFIQHIFDQKLGVSKQAYTMTKAVLPRFQLENGWIAIGKTGSGSVIGSNGLPDRKRPQGWFVGWAEKGDRKVIFVKHINGNTPSDTMGLTAREQFLAEFPKLIKE